MMVFFRNIWQRIKERKPMDKPFKLAVKTILEDEQGRCLLIRRSSISKHFAGCWEWPGGKVDPGEDFADAMLRETLEETGLEIELTSLAGATEFEMPLVHVVALCMEAKVTGGELKLSDEHDDSAWVPWTEFDQWNLTEHIKTFMLDYIKKKTCA
jgi:8-oxo-dGTP diphosphatase